MVPLILALALTACGSSRGYRDDHPLSGRTAPLTDGEQIVVGIPEGWEGSGGFIAGEGYSVLLVSGDSMRIALREISLDEAAVSYYREAEVAQLAALSRTLHDTAAAVETRGIREFSYGGREFAAYEYGGPDGPRRVVVFSAGGRFYECEAFSDGPLSGPASYGGLFSAQQAVLRSLR